MQKVFLLLFYLMCVTSVSAQKINKADDLKKFYIEYCSNIGNDNSLNLLYSKYCTTELTSAIKEVESDGLYEVFTIGATDNFVLAKNTLKVRKVNDYFVVSFNALTYPDKKTASVEVIVYVNDEGKIFRVKRPEDGYMVPEK